MAQSSGMMIAIAFSFTALQFVFLGLRIWARRIRKNALALDDFLVISASALFVICVVIPILVGCIAGDMGDHARTEGGHILPPSYLETVHSWVLRVFHTWPLTFAKLGILFFYRRIFRGTIFNVVSWFVIGLAILWWISFFFATLFECTPISLQFRVSVIDPRLTCVDHSKLYYAVAISDFLIDCLILSIPVPFVWKIQMPLRQKIVVSVAFLTGIVTIGASLTRLIVFIHAKERLDAGDMDFSWFTAPTEYWVLIEAALSVISACLPTIGPVFSNLSTITIIASFRSVFSLQSSRRKTPHKSSNASLGRPAGGATGFPDGQSGSSREYVMHNVPKTPGVTAIPKGRNSSEISD